MEGEHTSPVTTSALANEARLEAILEQDPAILGLDVLLLVGRQVINSFGHRIDLLAVDSQGTLYVIEVKKGRTPREVVAQALDYGYWISGLTLDDLAELYERHHDGETFETGFRARFDADPPASLSGDHQLVTVASALDPATDRIVRYVRERGVPVFVVFFQYFQDGEHEFLARTWDADPARTEQTPKPATKPKQPWNGQDFSVSFLEDRRSWDDAVRYGFVSGGGGRWYSQTLQALFPGSRVFVHIPKTGYVGVGRVTETAQPVRQFTVSLDGQVVPILDAPLTATRLGEDADSDELCEHLVRVEWIKTLPRDKAIWEKGMFANQNTVVRLRDQFTLERLIDSLDIDDRDEG
jgi:hypothetical protein